MSLPSADAADESRRSSGRASIASSTSPSRPTEEDRLPDEFFDDFENNDFLDGLVDTDDDDDDQYMTTQEDDDAKHNSDDHNDERRSRSRRRSNERSLPEVKDKLEEIKMLSENVRRRKRLLERELSAAGIASDCGSGSNSRRTSRRRSRSPPPSSSEHRRSTHDSWRQPQQRSDTRGRSRSRELRRRLEARRNRHASQSPPPSRRRRSSGGGGGRSSVGISFLDELERTFAEQGKEFPEKELLLQQQWLKNGQPKHPAAKRSRLQSPSRNRTVLLGTPTMMQQPMNAMPPAHFMMPNPAFQPPQQQQQPYQSMYQQPYSNLMAAANAIVPPQQQIPLQSPGYANTYGSSSHASYAGHPNSLLPTPMLNMQLPPADSIPITVIPDLSPESDVPPASVRVKLRALQQSKSAIRLLRRVDNQIPKTQFIFTSTTFATADEDNRRNNRNTAPICSLKNVTFAFTNNVTAVPVAVSAAMRSTNLGTDRSQLPARLQHITTVLGFNSAALAAATRLKLRASRVYDELRQAADSHEAKPTTAAVPAKSTLSKQPPRSRTADHYPQTPAANQLVARKSQPSMVPAPLPPPLPVVQTRSMHVQTGPPEPCAECCARAAIQHHTQAVQTEAPPKTASVRTQTVDTTNGSTAADSAKLPLQQSLSKMSAGQLVAMTDFARIINDPRPATSVELFTLRERLMDVYNLSQRDDEQVRRAERAKLNSVRSLLAEKTATLASKQPPAEQLQQHHPQQQLHHHTNTANSSAWAGQPYVDQSQDWRWQQQQQLQHERFPVGVGGGPNPWSDGMPPGGPQQSWPQRGSVYPPRGGGRGRGGF